MRWLARTAWMVADGCRHKHLAKFICQQLNAGDHRPNPMKDLLLDAALVCLVELLMDIAREHIATKREHYSRIVHAAQIVARNDYRVVEESLEPHAGGFSIVTVEVFDALWKNHLAEVLIRAEYQRHSLPRA